jgi:hypothetical protein
MEQAILHPFGLKTDHGGNDPRLQQENALQVQGSVSMIMLHMEERQIKWNFHVNEVLQIHL